MSEKEKIIRSEIASFKRKKIISLVIKGIIITFSILISLFILFNTLEFSFQFGVSIRSILFFTFILSCALLIVVFIVKPAIKLLNLNKAIKDDDAAKFIGNTFPEIKDKLLNILQLRTNMGSQLAMAGVNQKISQLPDVKFSEAVSNKENIRSLPWLIFPVAILILIFLSKPEIITQSSKRITQFNTEFIPQAPFNFVLDESILKAFKNDDYLLSIKIEGNNIPASVYVNDGERKLKMASVGNGLFQYTFNKIQGSKTIQFEAAGYYSKSFRLDVLNRPDLRAFNIYLDYPNYLNKKSELLSNVGSVQVPEGTQLKWQLSTSFADSVTIQFDKSNARIILQEVDNQLFEAKRTAKETEEYTINLENENSNNKDIINYRIDVIEDQYPKIETNIYQDTLLFSVIGLGGNISDDYGLRRLSLNYSINESSYRSVPIPIDNKQSNLRFYYTWNIDSLLTEGQEVSYYLQVWDNDGFNGSKSTKTGVFKFNVPSKAEIRSEVGKVAEQTKNDLDKTLKDAKELKEQLDEAERRVKGKKELNWQDNKLIRDLVEKREELDKAINELKEQNRKNELKRERFTPQDQRVQEKVEQLQKLMDDLLDEETKRLYDELKRLLEEQEDLEGIQEMIEKINNKETNLEQELERTLELFKKMKLEHDLNETINELKEQIEDQESLIRETQQPQGQEEKKSEKQERLDEKNQYDDNKNENESSKVLKEKQEKLQEEFSQLEEKLEDIKRQNQSLKNPESLPETEEEQNSIKENQQQSKEFLEENQQGQSKQKQQKAKEAMEKMAEKMEQMQASMETEAMQENLEDLRAIVHNLIKLSFDQEELMGEFQQVNQSDPKFVELSQKQLKLKDDSQIVQDSLLALASRVFQIASFVTREVGEMNERMDKSVEFIRERKKPQAVAEQQFAMTSMNNLALLLDDVLQQMQNAMADAMGKPQKKPGKAKTPSLSELQQQLNNQIEELKGSGKKGRELSEGLAELAAQQERIRKALEDAQKKAGQMEGGKKPGEGIAEKMEETERDLVNKQLTEETIRRQKEILTRLLESEEALREQELDQKRKGETANEYEKVIPDAFENYFKLKEQEIELLKTIPPKLYPYYKDEVNEYFKRIGNTTDNIKSE
ncbi:MAG: DUF4175 family protein [Fulvivirga sp.]|uniref:DUF4175 family protein n=1 Tax=Fulvivirga sp. TaxID=1931237 RepID=UPI0032EAD231